MHACYFDAVTYEGAAYCVGCLSPDTDVDNDPEVNPIFADSEWDSYPVCSACGREHDYVNLTTDGLRWRSRREWSPEVLAMVYPANHAGKLGGMLPSFTSVGSYPLIYTTEDDERYCGSCASNTDNAFPLTGVFVHYEGDAQTCDECGDEIESAYGPVSSF